MYKIYLKSVYFIIIIKNISN